MFIAYCVPTCLHLGSLTATIAGPRGDLQDFDLLPYNTDADNNSDMFVLKFLPHTCGMQGNLY